MCSKLSTNSILGTTVQGSDRLVSSVYVCVLLLHLLFFLDILTKGNKQLCR